MTPPSARQLQRGMQNSGGNDQGDRMGSLPDINRNKKGSDVRAARKATGLTRLDVAEPVGVSRDTVHYG